MTSSKFNYTFGSVLILIGITVPSITLIKVLRGEPPIDIRQQLLVGGTIFKIGLIIFGGIFLVRGRFSFFKLEKRPIEPLPDSKRKVTIIILATILLTAFVLRIYGLNNGLWYDEILTYVDFANTPFGEIITTFHSQNNHMLYSLLTHGSFLIFGESAWALRLPAALFGVASIWAVYLLGKQVSTTRESLLSAALLTFSYHHIWFSQNARGYSGLLFWSVFTSWLFVRGLREGQSRIWLFYAVSASLGVYTNMTMLFVIIGHFIIYLLALVPYRKYLWPERSAGFYLGFCLTGLLTLQLFSLVLPQLFGNVAEEGGAVAVWRNPIWTLLEFVKGFEVGLIGAFSGVVCLFIIGIGIKSYVRENPLVIQLLFIPVIAGAVVTIGMGHHLWPRFFFFSLGFAVIVVIRGIFVSGNIVSKLLRFEPERSGLIGTTLCVGVIIASSFSIPGVYSPKQDFLGALSFVEKHKKPGDKVATVGMAMLPYAEYLKTDWEKAETIASLDSIRANSKRTWLIYTVPIHLQSFYPEILNTINEDFKVIKQFYGTLGGGTIFVCRTDNLTS
ncbi:MAG: glycosyltransferase family 39 protein [Candidatus Scalindua sp.]|nr:glycosyltransferase family 39 protein [Candidatus Scalindua sp.]